MDAFGTRLTIAAGSMRGLPLRNRKKDFDAVDHFMETESPKRTNDGDTRETIAHGSMHGLPLRDGHRQFSGQQRRLQNNQELVLPQLKEEEGTRNAGGTRHTTTAGSTHGLPLHMQRPLRCQDSAGRRTWYMRTRWTV